MYVNIVELCGRDNPIKKATRDGTKTIYRARLKGDGAVKSMIISTEDIDEFEAALPGVTKFLSMFDVSLEKVEIGTDEETE